MKIKIFDVVELNNGNKATIIEINKNRYKVEIVDKHGKSKGIFQIEEKDIKRVIFSK
jgi:hypothetical protein